MTDNNSFSEIFQILKKKIGWIVASVIIFSCGFILFTHFFVTPKYTSSTQLAGKIISGNDNSASNLNDANFNLNMINTYKDLIETNAVKAGVRKKLLKDGVDITVGELSSMISVSQNANSQIFSIDVTTTSASVSKQIADITSAVFVAKVKDLGVDNQVSIVSEATLNEVPSSPNMKLNAAIGMVIGLVFGITIVFVIAYMDTTLKNESFITEALMLNRLGIVSMISEKESKSDTNYNVLFVDDYLQRQVRDTGYGPGRMKKKPPVPYEENRMESGRKEPGRMMESGKMESARKEYIEEYGYEDNIYRNKSNRRRTRDY